MNGEIENEFRAGLARAGLDVEAERYQALLEGFAGYRELAALLDEPLPPTAEPAGLYLPEAKP